MTQRVNSFAPLNDDVNFPTKPKQQKPVPEAAIETIAAQNNFPSRQAPKPQATPRRKPRVYRTGRNVQFNAKISLETMQRFYKAVEERGIVMGELIKQSLDALETLDALQKIANRRGVSLSVVVDEAVRTLDRAGGSREL